ncbi:uncharacterized protein LOC143198624 [Rhynchophorus ferrugineus]|uniref:Uncharacterized protein n=1 Tax=Rhynchophorus ferrugineus TaxID=354439 RepID=A0A834I1R2_RHYFE|nr:hypothetical protein GWI33_014392 [Rhynchophorus ferrugineus]
MVRKRSRTAKTRRNSKKNYESDDNDSDIDLELSSPPSSPARKRYGLRQRKQPVIFTDYDYDDDEDKNPEKTGSDEEYCVEVDLDSGQSNECKMSSKQDEECNNSVESSSYYNEHESEEISMENGLIDFEDVIRADVVNKRKVDYDNMITKTQIQIHGVNKPVAPVKEKGRRGRKPKRQVHENRISIPTIIGGINLTKNCHDDETKLEVQIDPSTLVQSDSDEHDAPHKSNGVTLKEDLNHSSHLGHPKSFHENGSNLCSWVDKIEKYIPPELDEKEKQVILSNEYLLANTFDISADEFLQKQGEKSKQEDIAENLPMVNFDDDDSSNDVVIIEKKPEIIVLDDD